MRKLHLAMAGATALLVAGACSDTSTTPNRFTPIKPSFTKINGAAFTSVNPADDPDHNVSNLCKNGDPEINCNIYTKKDFVWLNGGPASAQVGTADPGDYFFAVLAPGGQGGNDNPNDGATLNLSDLPNGDAYTNRVFTRNVDGTITYTGSHAISGVSQTDAGKIRLIPYDVTPKSGGVYILAICKLPTTIAATNPPGAVPSDCKYDAFKVDDGTLPPGPGFADPAVTKTAAGAYNTTYTWTINKTVDKTFVQQVGGNFTFHYTVTVGHSEGVVSGVTVTGKITATNGNTDTDGNRVPVDITGITDVLTDGVNPIGTCSVTGGGAQTLTELETVFDYTCNLTAVPTTALTNTATISWPAQVLANGAIVTAASADSPPVTVAAGSFVETVIDGQVTVTDTFDATAVTLGGTGHVVTYADVPNPTVFTYSHTVPAPASACVTHNNSAVFITNTTSATDHSDQSVQICGAATGGLTIGFWQNKNGQGIITSYCGSGATGLYTYLFGMNPFKDMSTTKTTCVDIAAYVAGVIKGANASGASMNAMLKAQMLATALDVYFSTTGGNKIGAPVPLGGVKIDLTKICKMIDGSGGVATCSGTYSNVSAVFGGATSMTISNILLYAASQSTAGGVSWYSQVKANQEMAKNTFDAINNGVALVAP
jgi:hypothetical protein